MNARLTSFASGINSDFESRNSDFGNGKKFQIRNSKLQILPHQFR